MTMVTITITLNGIKVFLGMSALAAMLLMLYLSKKYSADQYKRECRELDRLFRICTDCTRCQIKKLHQENQMDRDLEEQFGLR